MTLEFTFPTIIQATYRIITPMFIGDANQEATAVHPQSFKGALRFWWRAMVWGKIRHNTGSDEEALKELHRKEAELFGSSATKDEQIYGQGAVAIKTIQPKMFKSRSAETIHEKLKSRSGARYLGYGCVEAFDSQKKKTKAGQLIRECIEEGQEFIVYITVTQEKKSEIIAALKLLGLLGGLGSKMRKGYGSINLIKLITDEKSLWESPKTFEEYKKELSNLFPDSLPDALPPFTALSKNMLIKPIKKSSSGTSSDLSYTNCYDPLEEYGEAMLFYRSWGRQGKVLGRRASEKNFIKDHDWSKGKTYFNTQNHGVVYEEFHPQRVLFGLPHNYGKKQEQQVGRLLQDSNKSGRRASPLFFHVQQIGDSFYGIASLFKATFLSPNEKILAGKNKVTQKIDWDILQKNFLEDKKRFQPDLIYP